MATTTDTTQPVEPSSHLAEALRWLVEHSKADPDAEEPGALELAEVLWLASRLPPPAAPARRRARTAAPEPPREPLPPQPGAEPKEEANPTATSAGSPLPPDPFLPTPFPDRPSAPMDPEDTLLPVAMLPDKTDVAAALLGPGLPGRVRGTAPLGDRGQLLRALAPLQGRRPDPRQRHLDEERTVELYAESRLLQPVMVPAPGPLFDEVVLLVDGGVSMEV